MSFDAKGKEPIRQSEHEEYMPLVIVEGFLGGVGDIVWGNFEQYLNLDCRLSRRPRRKVLFPHIGPVSSLHDRACELYAALKGGKVDYGEDHARIHGHSRYGRTVDQGLYPAWSPQHPLHFLGHSIGGCTVIKLQYLLKEGHFGPSGHPDMVYSVSSICSPFNGTQVVYSLGTSLDRAPEVRPYSIGSAVLAKAVHIIAFLSPILPKFLDLHAESRDLSFQESTISSFIRDLWNSPWAASKDAAPFDVTFEAADEREARQEGAPNSNTYYRSYSAYFTSPVDKALSNMHQPSIARLFTPVLYLTSKTMGLFDFTALCPTPSFMRDNKSTKDPHIQQGPSYLGEEYWANDGVVPLFSQWHPFSCKKTRCRHHGPPTHTEESGILDVEPGIWHIFEANECHHLSVAPFWTASQQQRLFWEKIGDWLRAIE